jgi:hypothetical protein
MQLSDKDKDRILATKDNIRKLTSEIVILLPESQNNRDEILDKMSQIIGYISNLCAISNYLSSEPDLRDFKRDYRDIQDMFEVEGWKYILRNHVERFCSRANSVTFYEEKASLLSKIQIRLKNLNIINKPFSK